MNVLGERQRQQGQQWALKKLLAANDDFKQANDDLVAFSMKVADPAAMMEAVKVRLRCFPIMYAFYGNEMNAKTKFLNYIGAQRVTSMIVDFIVQTPDDVVFLGDSNNYNPHIKGHPSSRYVFFFLLLIMRILVLVLPVEFVLSYAVSRIE